MDYDLSLDEENVVCAALEDYIRFWRAAASTAGTPTQRTVMNDRADTSEIALHKIEAARMIGEA